MTPLVVDASVWVAAADRSDGVSDASRAFLQSVARRRVPVVIPAFARVEIACALARRLRDPRRARRLATGLLRSPVVAEQPLDDALVAGAIEHGTDALLRAGDAFYAATARRLGGEIVSWDMELVRRAPALTPEDWLAANG